MLFNSVGIINALDFHRLVSFPIRGISIGTPTLLLLILVAFLAGIGITAIGPGGVFVTIALSLLLPYPSLVAGTAGATNIATGIVGTGVYAKSGELQTPRGKRLAAVLSITGFAGALLGAETNAAVSADLFSLLLGIFVVLAGLLTLYRARYGGANNDFDVASRRGTVNAAILGFIIGIPGGLLGVGGPVLAVPVLIAVGVPLVLAVAVAQVQSVFIAGSATLEYLLRGAVSIELVGVIAVPELIGVVLGWQVAQRVNARWLKLALAIVLIVIGPYIALH